MLKKKYSIPKLIFVLVIGAHACLCYVLFVKGVSNKPLKQNLASIKTSFISVEPPKPKLQPSKPRQKQPSQKPKVKKEVIKVADNKPSPKSPMKLPERPVAQRTPEKKLELTVPKELKTLAVERKDNPMPNLPLSSVGYQEQLKAFLFSHLKMPREGEVLLEIRVNQSGNILGILVKKASDQEILNTIKEQIAKISLPPLDREFAGEKEHTFTFKFI